MRIVAHLSPLRVTFAMQTHSALAGSVTV